MKCSDPHMLGAYAEGRLTEAEGHEVESHLQTCPRCLAITAGLLADSLGDASNDSPPGPDLAAAIVSAAQASRLTVGRAGEALRIAGCHRLTVTAPSAFGNRFSVAGIFREPILPLRSFEFHLEGQVLEKGLLFPHGDSFSLHLEPREGEGPAEIEVVSGGRLLRNAYAREDGRFEIERLPRKRTLLVRDAGTRRTFLVLQVFPTTLASLEWAKLAVYLASQGQFDEAARIFEGQVEKNRQNTPVATRLRRIYETLRYGSVFFPGELAILRKRQGASTGKADEAGPAELPILARLAERYGLRNGYAAHASFVLSGLEAARRGDWDEAERLWAETQFLRDDPVLTVAQGWACLINNRRDEAVRWFEFALKKMPDQPDALMGLEFARRLEDHPEQEAAAEAVLAELLRDFCSSLENGEH